MESTEKPNPRTRRRLYLLRHGDVSYFDENGQPIRPTTVTLNAEGRRQAEAAAKALADVPIDRVISSDLVRSVETAGIITAGRGLHIESREELREIQPGRLSDIPIESLEKAFCEAFSANVDLETRFLAGETFGSLAERVSRFFHWILGESDWRDLMIVAHGGVNRTILALAFGVGLSGFGAIEQDPACINIIDVDPAGRCLVRLVNYTPYNVVKTGLDLTTMERLYRQYSRRVT